MHQGVPSNNSWVFKVLWSQALMLEAVREKNGLFIVVCVFSVFANSKGDWLTVDQLR
jgi:hypothetical protein